MRIRSILVLSAWGGLLAGLLEVGTIVLRKQVFDPDRFYRMSRHFLWLIPLSNLVIFLALGLIGCGIILVWPRQGRRLLPCVLGASMLLPALLVAFPRIYSLALLIVGLGLAAQCVAIVERRRRGFRRFVTVSFPAAIAIVTIMGASLLLVDHRKQARERAHTLPPAGSPNVLLIVLDTVAAGHLGLYGYDRATCPALVEAAEHAIRFDSARATSSWTLPSHASMFTGRWVHELSAGWFTPLDQRRPTLAEFLGGRGYATAGFVANTYYCATDSGLARGFNWYQDYVFPELTAFKTAVLVDRAIERLRAFTYYSGGWLDSAGLLPLAQRILRSLDDDRKGAAVVNREFLDWLATRGQPARPFFAFLNYNDAHYPYELPPERLHRFGARPADEYERLLIRRWGLLDKTTVSARGVAFAADAYDDCIADLDEQLGMLLDVLDRRGVLGQTWLIITADHGESFGEHAGCFCHGSSLYDTELHVPLLIRPPGGSASKHVVNEVVSLRDLAATIADLAGQGNGSPFPGAPLARFWKQPEPDASVDPAPATPALAEVVPHDADKGDYWGSPKQRPPLGAVKEREWSYIRRGTGAGELLFHLSEDAREQRNLAESPSAQTTLQRLRTALDRLAEGPLVPERFGR
jgi:arylsulfatase A-like enzyme